MLCLQPDGKRYVYVQAKRYGNDRGTWKDGFFDFNGKLFFLPVEFLWSTGNKILASLGTLDFKGVPFNYSNNIIFATEIHMGQPPTLEKMGIEYKATPFDLTCGKSFSFFQKKL